MLAKLVRDECGNIQQSLLSPPSTSSLEAAIAVAVIIGVFLAVFVVIVLVARVPVLHDEMVLVDLRLESACRSAACKESSLRKKEWDGAEAMGLRHRGRIAVNSLCPSQVGGMELGILLYVANVGMHPFKR